MNKNQEEIKKPDINWIKREENKNWFADGSVFLVAMSDRKGGFEYAVLTVTADEDNFGFHVETAHGGEPSDIDWTDVDYFHVIEGSAPVEPPDER